MYARASGSRIRWEQGVTVSDTESRLFVLQPAVDWVYLPVLLRN